MLVTGGLRFIDDLYTCAPLFCSVLNVAFAGEWARLRRGNVLYAIKNC